MTENTVKFRFPLSAPRPTWIEIAEFLKRLEPNVMEMETVYKMGEDRSLCIKFRTASAMEQALRRNAETVKFSYTNGRTVDIHMSRAGTNVRYVRVFDIPPEVSDEDLLMVLGAYGKIEKVIREKFPPNLGLDHMFNGVRGMYMDVDKDIPPTVDVLQWKGKVYYEELKNKCFLCQQEGHRRNACPQNVARIRNLNGERAGKPPNSYAAAVIQGSDVLVEQEVIEVVDEEVIEEVQLEAVPTEVESNEGQEKSKVTENVIYKSEHERTLAENWAKYEAEKRKRQEEYRKNEKSMQRRYQESLRMREREQKEHWEKCEAERKSRQEKYKQDQTQNLQTLPVENQLQSPPKKNPRKQ